MSFWDRDVLPLVVDGLPKRGCVEGGWSRGRMASQAWMGPQLWGHGMWDRMLFNRFEEPMQAMRDNDRDAHPTLAGTGVYPERSRCRKQFQAYYQELTY